MTEYSGSNRKKTAWCPLTETLQTTLTEPSSGYAPVRSVQPGGGGDGVGRRIGRGAGIATRSIKTLINDRKLLWYPLLAGFALFLMYLTEMAFKAYAIMTCSGSYGYWSLGYHYGFVLTFVVELIFFFCLNYIFAAIVIDISKNPENPGAVRKSLYSAKNYLKTIAGWSVILAVVATAIYAFVLQQPWHAHLYPALGTTMFQIPFVYYVPILPLATVTAVIEKILVAVPLFVLTLYVIPLLVLEKRSLSGAIAGLAGFFRRTWIEIIVCFLIFATVVVGITLLSPLICMTPLFVDYDYHFFAEYAIPMAAICFLFLALLWTAAASVFTTTGIAAVDLYKLGKKGRG
ncbi:hypothetical protein Mpet_0049 [Methanolacinia petrolearia DSM 11571]|uniref:Glycerophosphoryl diester phosphodiesterase membrane domain-containing protein n=1 Tax=Methanolacinia petrolearia (strain DSM 11571 / OCM 486 / SEBR 4847) TaxID=679926 RepID=E1RDE6_METP4|nr:hypothetical protein [Methanolacinia petrolearia]ADN34830.1 hypothetical protein Mpet_0049 [Methanolacinia petrolearia DSM 11571]